MILALGSCPGSCRAFCWLPPFCLRPVYERMIERVDSVAHNVWVLHKMVPFLSMGLQWSSKKPCRLYPCTTTTATACPLRAAAAQSAACLSGSLPQISPLPFAFAYLSLALRWGHSNYMALASSRRLRPPSRLWASGLLRHPWSIGRGRRLCNAGRGR